VKVHQLLSLATAPFTSSVVELQQRRDESGLVQIAVSSAVAAWTLEIQGRSDSDAPWQVLDTATESDIVINKTALISVNKNMPQMRLNLTSLSFGAMNAYLLE